MKYPEYEEASARTAPDLGEYNNNLHAILGMVSEVGELADALKRELAYGKAVDAQNILEEAGDFMWYMALYLRNYGIGAQPVEGLFTIPEGELERLETSLTRDKSEATGLLVAGMIKPLANLLTGDSIRVKAEAIQMLALFLTTLLKRYGYSIEQAMQANIDKLMVRYPEKFTQDNALTRNIEAEMQAMEKAIESRDD